MTDRFKSGRLPIGIAAIAIVFLVTVAATPPTPPPSTSSPTVNIPRRTVMYVTVTKDIRVGGAGTNSEVHKVKFEVTQDVILNGYVIAKRAISQRGSTPTKTTSPSASFPPTSRRRSPSTSMTL